MKRILGQMSTTSPQGVNAAKVAMLQSWIEFASGGPAPFAPAQVFIEASNVCDLKCVMCTQFSSINRNRAANLISVDRQFVDMKAVEGLDDALRHALVVHLHGGGEPTLHPNFMEAIRVLGFYDVMVEFFTNAMHITEELAASLVEERVHQVTVSWSGADKADYEAVYHGGVFEKLLEGLSRLRDAKKAKNSFYPRMSINSIAFRHHLERLDEFVDIATAHGITTIFVKPLNEWGFAAPELIGHAGFILPGSRAGEAEKKAQAIAKERGAQLLIEPYIYAASEGEADHKRFISSSLSEQAYADRKPVVPITELKAAAKALTKSDMLKGNKAELLGITRAVIDLSATSEAASAALGIEPYKWAGSEQFYCMEPFKTLYVEANRRAKSCCNMPVDVPALGKVGPEASGLAIWSGPGFKVLRDGVWRGAYSTRGCGDCLRAQSAPADHWMDTLAVYYDQWYAAKYGASLFGGDPYKLSGNTGSVIAANRAKM